MDESTEKRKVEEREFHDKLRKEYEQDPEHSHRFLTNKKYYAITRASARLHDRWIQENAIGKDVLDFGCGSGRTSLDAARVARSVTGIDISPESIEVARERAREAGVQARFLAMDGEAMDFPDESFDVVVEGGVLHHVDLAKALLEIRRVLRPGGRFLMVEALGNNPLIGLYRRKTPHLRTAWEAEHILRVADLGTVEQVFHVDGVRYFHLATLAAVPFRNTSGFMPLLTVLEAVDQAILRLPGVRRLAWQFMIECTKR